MSEKDSDLTDLGNSGIDLPHIVNPFPLEQDYVPESILEMQSSQIGDYNDIITINKAIDKVRIAMFKVNENLRQAEAKVSESKVEYDRRYNRAYILADNAKTSEVRRTIAQIKTEKYENKLIVRQEVVKELVRRTRLMSNELEALKTLSYNVRKEMDSSR
jgi:ribosomal protein L29